MKRTILIFALIAGCLCAHAQMLNPVKWSYAAKRTSATTAVLYLKANVEKGGHIYSAYQ